MAAPKLTNEQREQLIEWIAAEYSVKLIRQWFNDAEWPELTRSAISYYRTKYSAEIEEVRAERRKQAMLTGLALKEERLARLKAHADELDVIKWVADPKTGRLWNEKAWRETLDDIAKEMGHRRQGIDLALEQEIEAFLDKLRANLSPEEYARVLSVAAE